MKIFYLIKQELDPTAQTILAEHRRDNEVIQIDLGPGTDHDEIIDQLEQCDRVICW